MPNTWTDNDTELAAAAYEAVRTNAKKRSIYDRMPGWAYLDAMNALGYNDAFNPKYTPVLRHTVLSDNRPAAFRYTGAPGDRYLTPSARAHARYMYSMKPGELLPGELDFHKAHAGFNNVVSNDLFNWAAYKTGVMDPNSYHTYKNRDSQYVPDPVGYGGVNVWRDNNNRILDARTTGGLMGSGINMAANFIPTHAVAKGVLSIPRYANIGYKSLRAGKAVIPRLKAIPRFNAIQSKASFVGGVNGAAKSIGVGAATAGSMGLYALADEYRRQNGIRASAIATKQSELAIPEQWHKHFFELPVIGYTKGPDGPKPARANYADFYNHLRRTRGENIANQFRAYHLNKGVKSNEASYNNAFAQYDSEVAKLNSGNYTDDEYNKRMTELNNKYKPQLTKQTEGLVRSNQAIEDFNKGNNSK